MAAHMAGKAYRSAMPDLAGYANIQDFIACTAYGMLMNTISASDATKLLYAAQVALSTLRSEPKAPKSSTATPPTPSPSLPQQS